jgi:hypothetical protein
LLNWGRHLSKEDPIRTIVKRLIPTSC